MHLPRCTRRVLALLALSLLLLPTPPVEAYSVLSHEQVVDLAWTTHIVPLLEARFPGQSPAHLQRDHAFAYGGAIIQDIGYYPFGSKLLSDMLHYVRSGEFVSNLVRDSTTPEEYAFALGALAHYDADCYGHPVVNRATAVEYPRLRHHFGPIVTYGEDPRAHLQTEFGFDVLEVAQQRFAPQAYHDFIGFEVAKGVFERAFEDTYGLPLDQVLAHEDLAFGTYRKTVSTLLPKVTSIAIANYGKQMRQAEPALVPGHLRYRLSNADYQRQWGSSYQKPGAGARIVAFFVRILPKFGPLRDLSLRVPDAATQKQFLDGMNTTVDHYHQALDVLRAEPPDQPSLSLAAVDLDTGNVTAPGEYALADRTYADYLALLVRPRLPEPSAPAAISPSTAMVPASLAVPARQSPGSATAGAAIQPVDPAVRADIEHYFATARPGTLKLKRRQWRSMPGDLDRLRQAPAAEHPSPAASALKAGS